MGPYDRNNYRNRPRDFDRDPRLDDRTGYGPGSAGGYRSYGRERDHDRDDGRAYGDYEDRSFSRRDEHGYGVGGRDRGGGYDRSRHEPRYESYAFNPYDAAAFSPGFGFGQPLEGYDRRPSYDRSEYSGRERDDRNWFDRAADEVSSWFGDDEARRRRERDMREHGSHAGRGPKNYTRSEDRIREDVNDRLTDDVWLDASHIEVQVSGNEVTLAGTVSSREDKRRAERLAEYVSGVNHVQNNLRVNQADWRDDPTTGSTASTGSSTIDRLGRPAGKA